MAQVLRRLHNLEATRHPNLIAGIGGSEDAGVFRISDDVAIVQSVDFFTPIVDEAADWGRIVAANALSDLYAMGAQPLTALQVVGWPRGVLPYELLGDVLDGAAEVLSEARCTLVGGHTVDDPEPKFGMSVTGLVHPDDVVTNSAGEPGDVLVLTKPLGTGIIATAIKRGKAAAADRDAAVRSMVTLNAGAAIAMRRVGVRAATDITGFGLLGHLGEMLRAGSVSARINAAAVPLLSGAFEGAAAGLVPGGTERNLAAAAAFTTFVDVDADLQTVLADAQTSGGLLLAIEPPLEKALHQALEDEGVRGASIGVLTERAFSDGPTGRITVQ